MVNSLFGMTRVLDCRSRSGVDDGIDTGVGYFLGAGRMTNGLRGYGVGDRIAASFQYLSVPHRVLQDSNDS